MNKGFENNKAVKITLSKIQLKYNKHKVKGGFLSALMELARVTAPTLARNVLPSVAKHLAIGGLSAIGTSAINKILGNGIFIKSNEGGMYNIKSFGKGLYLSNKSKLPSDLQNVGEGMYIKSPEDNSWFYGSGIVHEIAKEIPLLNLIF